MAYDINAALERLETNLAEVESAKKQVEETIATSESLQQIIGRYSESLSSKSEEIIEDVSKAIQKLDNQNSVLTETKKLCDDIKGDIGNLKDSIDAQFESMRSTININRWILIIGLLALMTLIFMKG